MSSILITGGSGFLGRSLASAFSRRTDYSRICIYSRGEHAQAEMRSRIPPEHQSRFRFFVGDVRDLTRLRRAMAGCNTVIHAAALKRVEVGEYCPDEMVRTNVDGTMNVIEAARDLGVKKVLLVSSDKACQPLNAYGATKLLAEKLFLAANGGGTKYSVVRYGNVAGSTGSVIPFWRQQIAAGDFIPLTDPEMTRFWMPVSAACDLIDFCLNHMRGGETVVPSLYAYRLQDLANVCTFLWGGQVRTIGARPGEKAHESMICAEEMGEFKQVGDYWLRGWSDGVPLTAPLTSDAAPRMTPLQLVDDLKALRWPRLFQCGG